MSTEQTPPLAATRPPLPLPSPAPSPTSLYIPPNTPFLIRRALPSDAHTIARIATTSYAYSGFADILNPNRFRFWSDWVTEFQRKNHLRMLNASQLIYLAYPATSPTTVVGFANFQRGGNDAAAKAMRAAFGGVLQSVRLWWYERWYAVLGWVWPSRATDPAVLRMLESGGANVVSTLAGKEENRWYCGSCVVLPEWERRGVAKVMMQMGLAVAEAEGVPLLLEASPEGEGLYRRLGFVRVAQFGEQWLEGGVMIWLPKWREGERKWWECRADGGEGRGLDIQKKVGPGDEVVEVEEV